MPDEKEKIPRKYNRRDALNRWPHTGKNTLLRGFWFRERFQAGRANNAVVVLGNALAAEEP